MKTTALAGMLDSTAAANSGFMSVPQTTALENRRDTASVSTPLATDAYAMRRADVCRNGYDLVQFSRTQMENLVKRHCGKCTAHYRSEKTHIAIGPKGCDARIYSLAA